MFTRRHYVAIAEVLKQAREAEVAAGIGKRELAKVKLALMFAADNPRFDIEKFFDACEPTE